MSKHTYPDPDISVETEAYWQAANDGKLLVKKCDACGKTHFYPRSICPCCFSNETSWMEASGKGHVYSYSVMRRAKQPYAIAYVRLEEDVTMLTNLVEADLDELRVEMPVEVTFRKSESGQALPVFRPLKD
ncbi:Zn-ribbon domain-containing OB-fold protein [Nitratireductor sp. XY-223]|uniref:Zn-ribbon domain-containing OB-fold protein n=1 Tax=Nitratireductor sp. XY-223 TaxID=2561926 RepID=UPI0010A9FE57|nr:Zn-ribbon domain-containing OB-fold protein [Nitratireductor sp. XY-223]